MGLEQSIEEVRTALDQGGARWTAGGRRRRWNLSLRQKQFCVLARCRPNTTMELREAQAREDSAPGGRDRGRHAAAVRLCAPRADWTT